MNLEEFKKAGHELEHTEQSNKRMFKRIFNCAKCGTLYHYDVMVDIILLCEAIDINVLTPSTLDKFTCAELIMKAVLK